MAKADLVRELKEQAGLKSLTIAEEVYDTFLSVLVKNLKADGKCQINNFGSLTLVKRKARMGRNPRTGKAIQIPAADAVKFVASKSLKDSVK
ncbi:DNA-binding protein HU [Deltaproteobacteria bacterium]|nr:DNA-binding protein HU [Deltaproteobacteria bacterium]